MPSSKEVRARQNRQKERIAAQLAERRRVQQRRRRFGAVAAVIGLVVIVALGFVAVSNGDGPKVAVSPTTVAPGTTTTTTPTTTTVAPSAKGKPCVGLKDSLPKGAPAMLLVPGPAPTKLSTQDLKVGSGAVVPKNAKVTVNYVGVACSTGKIFDSSYSRNQTFDADLASGVIQGWIRGIPGMRIGGVRLLAIPSDLAYGAAGASPSIAPDEALYFLVAALKLA
ncbi:MAG: FKBP-type peptidyl-prolyl cis-trans isomerase [Actinomycetota bacterium]|nr:FKBP-type peptidyl-prolyl cis-trans isomerase [Actinomycetota bacterium]